MCSVNRVQYSCGCVKDSKFVQCEKRRGTPVKCDKISRDIAEISDNYCITHCIPDLGRGYTKADFIQLPNSTFKTVDRQGRGTEL